jgi:acyl transferase domain-containing protein
MLKNAYSLIFLFPGQGTQYIKMGYALYNNEPVFRAEFDKCCNIFYAEMKEDIRNTIFSDSPDAIEKIKDTYFAQPALFALEYSLSCLWKDWGIQPSMLVGHSIGEFVAACISGIMQIEDAAKLVAIRARLMHDLPHGTMMSVRLPEHEILKILPSELSIAAVNSPVLSVVSGSSEAINEFKTYCEIKNVACRFLHTSHAFHSAMVDPIIPTFSKEVHKIRLSSPNIPIISTVTGKLLTTMEAIDPEYWTRHMRSTVRFSDAIRIALDSENDNIFLEVGPRATSTILVNQHIATNPHHYAIPSLGNTDEPDLEYKDLMNAIGQLWQLGVSIDWQSYYKNEKRLKLSIPIYPFEKQKYWIEPGIQNTIAKPTEITSSENNNATVNIEQSINLQDKKTDAGINITDEIKKIITEATGDEAYCSDESATFLQMGLDSLFLTQLSQRLRSKFNVTVSMRQLMRETTTINKLAEFIYNKNNK